MSLCTLRTFAGITVALFALNSVTVTDSAWSANAQAKSPTPNQTKKMKAGERAYFCGMILIAAAITIPLVETLTPHTWYSGNPVPESVIQNQITKRGTTHWLSAVMESMSPEQLAELGSEGVLARGTFSSNMTLDYLKKLLSEMKFPSRFNKIYWSGEMHDEATEAIQALIRGMEWVGESQVFQLQIQTEADLRIKKLRDEKTIGQIYWLNSIRYPRLLLTWLQPIVVSEKVQREIEGSFEKSKRDPLSVEDTRKVTDGVAPENDLRELRGLKGAVRIFEQNSPVNGKPRGNAWTNARAELLGGNRQVCSNCEATYSRFLSSLGKQGLLSQVVSWKTIKRDWGIDDKHVAVEMTTRSGGRFVLDAWHEPGGSAPHIVSVQDWLNRNDFNDVVSEFPKSNLVD